MKKKPTALGGLKAPSKPSEKLLERVTEQFRENISYGDYEAIEELLAFVPVENLIAFLPEEEWKNFTSKKQKRGIR